MSQLEWRDRAYEETLEAVLSGLEARRRSDAVYTVRDAEGVLEHLYIHEGHDYGSRGMIQDAVMGATIAAHEQFIQAWKSEAAPVDPIPTDRSRP